MRDSLTLRSFFILSPVLNVLILIIFHHYAGMDKSFLDPVVYWATIVLIVVAQLTLGGITIALLLHTRKLPTGQPMFLLWLPSSISWLSWATIKTLTWISENICI